MIFSYKPKRGIVALLLSFWKHEVSRPNHAFARASLTMFDAKRTVQQIPADGLALRRRKRIFIGVEKRVYFENIVEPTASWPSEHS